RASNGITKSSTIVFDGIGWYSDFRMAYMAPLEPSSAPSRLSHFFKNVSYFQYRLSTFRPIRGSVNTRRPHTTPTVGSRNQLARRSAALACVNELASESMTTSLDSFGITSFNTLALPRRMGNETSLTPNRSYSRTISL